MLTRKMHVTLKKDSVQADYQVLFLTVHIHVILPNAPKYRNKLAKKMLHNKIEGAFLGRSTGF